MASKWVSLPASRVSVVRLYRKILQAARLYPSVKRDSIIADIKLEFREPLRNHIVREKDPISSSTEKVDKNVAIVKTTERHKNPKNPKLDEFQERIDIALNGLHTLQSYSKYRTNNFDPNWSLKLLDNPVTAGLDAEAERHNFLCLSQEHQTLVLDSVGLANGPLTAEQIEASATQTSQISDGKEKIDDKNGNNIGDK